MNHDALVPLLDDLVSGRLGSAQSAAAWSHVATCPDCQDALSATHMVRAAVAAAGKSCFDDHPTADALSGFAFADLDINVPDMAWIGRHVQECPTCRGEVDLARAADRQAPTWIEGALAGLRGLWRVEPAGRLVPALAVLALILALPAYWGLVDLPGLRRTNQRTLKEVETLRVEGNSLRADMRATRARPGDPGPWGGAIRLLYLHDTGRGTASVPTVTLMPGQPYQPVVLDYDLSGVAARRPQTSVELTLRRVPQGASAWTHTGTASELWDAGSQTINVLVPAAVLEPGAYRLELRVGADGERRAVGSFRVTAGTTTDRDSARR